MTDTQFVKELDTMEFDIEKLRLQNLLQRKGEEFERLTEEARDIYREWLIVRNQYFEHIGKIIHKGRL